MLFNSFRYILLFLPIVALGYAAVQKYIWSKKLHRACCSRHRFCSTTTRPGRMNSARPKGFVYFAL